VEALFRRVISILYGPQSQTLDEDNKPTDKIPRGLKTGLLNWSLANPRLVPETFRHFIESRQKLAEKMLTLCPLYANCYDQQMTFQHQHQQPTDVFLTNTVTQREIL